MNEKPNAAPVFKYAGKVDFHMSAEFDLVIGTDLYYAAPNLPDSETRESVEAIMGIAYEFKGELWPAGACEKLRAAVERVTFGRATYQTAFHEQLARAERAEQEAAALRELLGEARHFVRERGSDPALLARIDAALKP